MGRCDAAGAVGVLPMFGDPDDVRLTAARSAVTDTIAFNLELAGPHEVELLDDPGIVTRTH